MAYEKNRKRKIPKKETITMMKKEKGMSYKKSGAKKAAAKKGVALTPAQKKLPAFIQKSIMNKKGKK